MASTSLIKKLRLQPGQHALIPKAPEGFIQLLGDLPEGVEISSSSEGIYDFILLFVNNVAEFEAEVPAATRVGKYDCLLWVAYPKQSSGVKTDIHRDITWKLAEKVRLHPVAQIALDDIWSALRFRPAERVGS